MKKWKWKKWFIHVSVVVIGCMLFLSFHSHAVLGAETGEELLEELIDQMDFSKLDSFMDEVGSEKSFYQVLSELLKDGWNVLSMEKLMRWLWKQLFFELQMNKTLFLEVILIAFCFSMLKNMAGSFGNGYLSDSCFLLVYSVLGLLLLKSMYLFQDIVADALEKCVSFLQIFLPCFCTGMFLSASTYSATGFCQAAFLVIYIVERFFQSILLPGIHVYILLQIFNHFFEEGRFGNLAELIETLIQWGLKAAMTLVVGLSAVQNLINPVKDRMSWGILGKTVSAIPGIGNAVGGMNEVLLGAGMMIKNGIGLTGIIAMLFVGISPLLKTICMIFSYKLLAAMTEPLTDHRISSCLKDLSNGALLYMKLLGYSLLLFFVLIAITVSATSFVH